MDLQEPSLSDERLRFAILVNRGRFDEARELFQHLPSAPIESKDWAFVLAVAQMRLHFGEKEKAVATVVKLRDRAAEFRDQAGPVLLKCAGFFETIGDAVEAEKAQEMAVQRLRNPAQVTASIHRAIAAGKHGLARKLSIHIEEMFKDDVALLDIAAQTYHTVGDLDAAERVCRAGLVLQPDHAGLQARLGYILARQSRNEEAAEALEAAVALDTQNVRALERLVGVLLKLRQFDKTEQYAMALIALAPQNAQAEMFLASALRQTRRIEDALVHAKRATEIEPANEAFKKYLLELSTPKRKPQRSGGPPGRNRSEPKGPDTEIVSEDCKEEGTEPPLKSAEQRGSSQ